MPAGPIASTILEPGVLSAMGADDVMEGATLHIGEIDRELHFPRNVPDLLLVKPGVSMPAMKILLVSSDFQPLASTSSYRLPRYSLRISLTRGCGARSTNPWSSVRTLPVFDLVHPPRLSISEDPSQGYRRASFVSRS